jgi:hypothetical protein
MTAVLEIQDECTSADKRKIDRAKTLALVPNRQMVPARFKVSASACPEELLEALCPFPENHGAGRVEHHIRLPVGVF